MRVGNVVAAYHLVGLIALTTDVPIESYNIVLSVAILAFVSEVTQPFFLT